MLQTTGNVTEILSLSLLALEKKIAAILTDK